MNRLKLLLIPLFALSCLSCTAYSEQYYVGVRKSSSGNQMVPLEYYRFDLSGYSYCGRTEFQSGWYDSNALDVIFSEVVTETSARNLTRRPAMMILCSSPSQCHWLPDLAPSQS